MTDKKKIDIEKGPFGLPVGGLFAIAFFGSLPVAWVLEWTGMIGPGFDGDPNLGPGYVMCTVAGLIEWGHSWWKKKRINDGG